MNERQAALDRRYHDDPRFARVFDRAANPVEAVRVAAAHGLELTVPDLLPADGDDLDDTELELAGGAAMMTEAAGICWTGGTCAPYCRG